MIYVSIKSVSEKGLPLLPAIREYAEGNYKYGWDLIVEAWSDEDILRYLDGVASFPAAIKKLNKVVRIHKAYAYEIENA